MARWCAPALLIVALLAGCRKEDNLPLLPPLFPVKGQIVKGDVPVRGGAITFVRLNDQTPLIIISDVDQTGAFDLATVQGRKKVPGAPEGQYHVTYSPPVIGKQSLPITPRKTYTVTAGANSIHIALDDGE